MIKFHQVTKKFESGTVALENVDLEINPQEFVFVVGPSGAGKTTLMRLVIRDILPSEGEIFVHDWKLNNLPSSQVPQLRRLIGMIFQDFKILSDRTAYENVALPLEISGLKENKVEDSVLSALEQVGLIHRAHFFPVQLSSGELQRVSLARAIVGEPKIILADEPTGNLDPKTSWEIINLLKKAHQQGHTVVVATHDQDVVNSLEERVICLDNGRVVRDERKGKYAS